MRLASRDKLSLASTLVLCVFVIVVFADSAVGRWHEGKPWVKQASVAAIWAIVAVVYSVNSRKTSRS